MVTPGRFEIHEARFPVRFHMLTDRIEHEAETISLSPERLTICTETKLYVGEHLSLNIRFPTLSDGSSYELGFNGFVICGDKLAEGKFGCQIQIERNSFHIAFKQSEIGRQSS